MNRNIRSLHNGFSFVKARYQRFGLDLFYPPLSSIQTLDVSGSSVGHLMK